MNQTSEFSAVNGRDVTLGADYANWNYVVSTRWYDSQGKLLGSGGSYTFRQGNSDQTFKVVLTNESGVEISREFTIKNSVVIPTLTVDGEEQETLRAIVTQGHDVVMKGKITSVRYRDGIYTWSSGEHTESVSFENVQSSIYRHLDWIDTSSSIKTYEAHFDFEVKVYKEGRSLDDGYYRMKERSTGKYLNSRTMKFETLEGEGDSTAFIWHYTWLDDMERYKIQNHNDSAYLNNEGALTDRVYSKARSSFYLYTLVGGEDLECFVRTPERYGSYYWETDGETLVCDQADKMPSDFPFVLEKVAGDGGETDISETVVRDAAFTVDVTRSGIAVTSGSEVGMTVCTMAGSPVMRTRLGAGTHTINTVPLAPGIYIVRVTDGNTVRSVKFVR